MPVPQRLVACYGSRELGMTTVDLGKRLNLAQPTISHAVARGQKIAQQFSERLLDK